MSYPKIKSMAVLILSMAVSLVPICAASKTLLNVTPDDLAIKGYDPVAYFTAGIATQGSPEFQYEWNGAFWRFISAEHRQLFVAAPEKYAPMFGGHCAYGVATGRLLDIDPEAWIIEHGKLYLFHTKKIKEQWINDPAVLLEQAYDKWREMEGK